MKTIIVILLLLNIAIMSSNKICLWNNPEQVQLDVHEFNKEYRLWYTKEGIVISHIGKCVNTYNIQNGMIVQHDTECDNDD